MPDRRSPNLLSRLQVALVASAAALAAVAPAVAQFADDAPRAYQAPERKARAARNDAYAGPSNTPGLGTIGGSDTNGYASSGYNTPPQASQGYPSGAAVPAGRDPYAQSSQGAYTPSYGAPARPYGSNSTPPSAVGGPEPSYQQDRYAPPAGTRGSDDAYRSNQASGNGGDSYGNGGYGSAPPPYRSGQAYSANDSYRSGPVASDRYDGAGRPYSAGPGDYDRGGYGYDDEGRYQNRGPEGRYENDSRPPPPHPERRDGTFTSDEIMATGHKFFGSVSQGLAKVVEYAFKRQGRPNGYILGEDAGGAFVAGLRYGEGYLYTRDAGTHKVYWQGPSIGWDAGAAGSKVMVLVYNLRDPGEIYERFGGVDGSAYVFGGIGLTFQKRDEIVLAPIRSGVGLRLGANVGYLKYTRHATWNPF